MTDQLKSDMIKKVLEKALWLMDKMNSSLVRMRGEPNWGDYNNYGEKISDLRQQVDMIEHMDIADKNDGNPKSERVNNEHRPYNFIPA